MKTIVIIQARVNSTRLPNKVNLPLAGKSMVQNVYERCARATKIDDCVLAWAHEYANIPEWDVVGRLYACAKKIYDVHGVIRVCADNPCVEPQEIDKLAMLTFPRERNMRTEVYSTAERPHVPCHDGFGGELYTLRQLEWMDRVVKDTMYREHPHKFWIDIGNYRYVGRQYHSGFRLDVNDQKDYEKVKDIYDHFQNNTFTVKQVREYLDEKDLEKRRIPA